MDFFILADAEYYVIYHLYVYQGKNEANVDIDDILYSLTTTQRTVANAIIQSGIGNDPDLETLIYG